MNFRINSWQRTILIVAAVVFAANSVGDNGLRISASIAAVVALLLAVGSLPNYNEIEWRRGFSGLWQATKRHRWPVLCVLTLVFVFGIQFLRPTKEVAISEYEASVDELVVDAPVEAAVTELSKDAPPKRAVMPQPARIAAPNPPEDPVEYYLYRQREAQISTNLDASDAEVGGVVGGEDESNDYDPLDPTSFPENR